MPSLKDLKIRIESVTSTRKITKAMQMVAAAKLRRAQEAVENARPYSERISAIVGSIAHGLEDADNVPMLLRGTGRDTVHLLVCATAERGLCGGFNSSIVKLVRTRAAQLLEQGKTVKIMTVGKKGREQLRRDYDESIISHTDLSHVKKIGYAEAQGVANEIIARFGNGEFDVASIHYSVFRSVVVQVPTAVQMVPAVPSAGGGAAESFHEYEPEEEEILASLLPRALTAQVYAALLENAASEQGARMSAMDNATRNAGEMIDSLTIEYNRSRQAAITNELIEIISGAEAL